jgi:capsular exopolysaccharide synthesis family protein
VSRFFEALERAERERTTQAGTSEPAAEARSEPPTPGSARAASAPVEAPVARKERPTGPHARPTSVPVEAQIWRTPEVARVAPRDAVGMDDHLVSLLRPASPEAERYRSLRHSVEQLRKSEDLAVLAVSSPAVNDGKTTTALNLAGALAHAPDARVLVVELDLRRPSLARQLGLDEQPTLMDAVYRNRPLRQVVHRCRPENLHVVPAGRPVVTPYEVLKSARLGELVEEARREYEYVLLDTPPLVPMADVRLIGHLVDGFLLVVTADKTPRGLVEESLRELDGFRVVGVVFNRDGRARDAYYDYAGSEASPLDSTERNGQVGYASRMRRLLAWGRSVGG